jgi:hypothetical protein
VRIRSVLRAPVVKLLLIATQVTICPCISRAVSLVSWAIVLLLVLSELSGVIFPRRMEHVSVDEVIEGRLRINFDITFHSLSCGDANIDAMDVAGRCR